MALLAGEENIREVIAYPKTQSGVDPLMGSPTPVGERELTELGLGPQLAATGIATSEQAHFDTHGSLIWGEPRGRGLGYAWPQYSIHRGDGDGFHGP